MKSDDPVFAGVPEGWQGMVMQLLLDLDAINPHYRVTKVKARHGSLRFYAEGLTDEQWTVVRQAERRSLELCETCGAPGRMTAVGNLFARGSSTATRCTTHYFGSLHDDPSWTLVSAR